jgi:hypothetical protein
MNDRNRKGGLDLVAGRETQACVKLSEAESRQQSQQAGVAAMNRGVPVLVGTRQTDPHAGTTYDGLHVSNSHDEAVERSRRDESAKFAARGDDTLKRTGCLWLPG